MLPTLNLGEAYTYVDFLGEEFYGENPLGAICSRSYALTKRSRNQE